MVKLFQNVYYNITTRIIFLKRKNHETNETESKVLMKDERIHVAYL